MPWSSERPSHPRLQDTEGSCDDGHDRTTAAVHHRRGGRSRRRSRRCAGHGPDGAHRSATRCRRRMGLPPVLWLVFGAIDLRQTRQAPLERLPRVGDGREKAIGERPNVDIIEAVVAGPPKRALLAHSVGGELVVLSCRGLGAFLGMPLDSVSSYVTLHSRCSVAESSPTTASSGEGTSPRRRGRRSMSS